MPHALDRARLAAVLLIGIALAATAGPASADRASQLRAERASLEKQERQALMDIYAESAAVERARAARDAAQARVEQIGREQDSARTRLALARRNLRVAREALGQRLVFWYKSRGLDSLELLLGARSFTAALRQVEAIRLSASQDAALLEQTRAARSTYSAAAARLQLAATRARAEADARAASAAELERAVAGRRALIAQLRDRKSGIAGELGRIADRAQAAAERSQELVTSSTVSAPEATTEPQPAPVAEPTPSIAPGVSWTVESTAYDLTGNTASGLPAGPGMCAVDPGVIPLGTRFDVEGYGTCLAADTGSAIQGMIIDVWLPTAQALAWGRRSVTITFR